MITVWSFLTTTFGVCTNCNRVLPTRVYKKFTLYTRGSIPKICCLVIFYYTTVYTSTGDESSNIKADVTGQKGYFTEVPVNTAAAIGTSAQLNCSANLSPSASGSEDVVEWRHYIHDSTGSRIYVSSTGEIFDSRYDVKTTSSGGYHLVIKSASADVGGQYLCWLFNAYSKAPCEFVAVCMFLLPIFV